MQVVLHRHMVSGRVGEQFLDDRTALDEDPLRI